MKCEEVAYHAGRVGEHVARVSHFRWLYNYAVSLRSRMGVFIWIPKTGGTSVMEALRPARIQYFKTARDVLYSFPQRGLATFGHMEYGVLLRNGLIDHDFHRSSFRFCFVRNPFTRAVSLYHYLVRKKHVPASLGFEEFICGIERKGVPSVALDTWLGVSQCNPQCAWTRGAAPMTFVGRFERLEEDYSIVCAELGLKRIEALPVRNRRVRGADDEALLSGRAIDAIRRYFADDFQEFGYSLQPEDASL